MKGKIVGNGNFGEVSIVQKINYQDMSFVMKRINLESGYEEFLQREYDILRKMDHPFITTIVEAYYNEQEQVLSMIYPFYEGGEVTNIIDIEDRIPSERNVARTIY